MPPGILNINPVPFVRSRAPATAPEVLRSYQRTAEAVTRSAPTRDLQKESAQSAGTFAAQLQSVISQQAEAADQIYRLTKSRENTYAAETLLRDAKEYAETATIASLNTIVRDGVNEAFQERFSQFDEVTERARSHLQTESGVKREFTFVSAEAIESLTRQASIDREGLNLSNVDLLSAESAAEAIRRIDVAVGLLEARRAALDTAVDSARELTPTESPIDSLPPDLKSRVYTDLDLQNVKRMSADAAAGLSQTRIGITNVHPRALPNLGS